MRSTLTQSSPSSCAVCALRHDPLMDRGAPDGEALRDGESRFTEAT